MNHFSDIQTQTSEYECPACGSRSISSSEEIETFQYGERDPKANLTVFVPVHHCSDCGLSFTGEEAEDIRHNEVCRYLSVLNPREVRAVRERHNLSQSQFSELTRIGKASLARWESGQLIQNQANDNLLYLLTFDENLQRLQERNSKHDKITTKNVKVVAFRPKFQRIRNGEIESLKSEAAKFELFPAMIG